MIKHVFIGIFSTILVVASLLIPTEVPSKTESSSIMYGYPIAYILQDQSRLDPPNYPRKHSFGNPLEFPKLCFLG